MSRYYAEIGNVLTKAMRLDEGALPSATVADIAASCTPTSLHWPVADPGAGLRQVLAALHGNDRPAAIQQSTAIQSAAEPFAASSATARSAAAGPTPLAGTPGSAEKRVALIHLWGLPRAAVIGVLGGQSMELTVHAALRQGYSSLIQVRSTGAAADLESQSIDVRSRPLDALIFTRPTRSMVERIMAGGGPRPRVLPRLGAIYNGLAGKHGDITAALAGQVDLEVVDPVRLDNSRVDPEPTEKALSSLVARVLAADPALAAARDAGFELYTFGHAITKACERLAEAWSAALRPAEDGDQRPAAGVTLVDLGGRFTEMASSITTPASRFVDDLFERQIAAARPAATTRKKPSPAAGRTAPRADASGRQFDVQSLSRWLPYEWSGIALADMLANYLRRPFIFPATWSDLMFLLALGRERLAWARAGLRPSPGDNSVDGDWRRATGMYVLSGGYLRHLPGPGLALALALDGLEPTVVAEVWCDRFGLAPYLAASGGWPADGPAPGPWAMRLATVVSPLDLRLDWRRPHEDDLLAVVIVERERGGSSTFRIVPGSMMRFPLAPGEKARLEVHPMRDHDFGAGPGRPWRGTVTGGRLGLVFDSRGRPVALPPDPQVRQAKLREWLNTLGAREGWEGRAR